MRAGYWVAGAALVAGALGVVVWRGRRQAAAASATPVRPVSETPAGGAPAPSVVPGAAVGTLPPPSATGVPPPSVGKPVVVTFDDLAPSGNTGIAPPSRTLGLPGASMTESQVLASTGAVMAKLPFKLGGGGDSSASSASGGGGLGVVATAGLKQGLSAVLGSGTAATIGAGFQFADAVRKGMTQVGGVGVGDVSAVVSGAAPGLLVKTGAEQLGAALGIPSEFNQRIAQTIGVAVSDPTGIVTSLKVTGELASLGLRAVAGAQVEHDVRNAVAQLDPTNSKTVPGQAVHAVAEGVSSIANIFKGKWPWDK